MKNVIISTIFLAFLATACSPQNSTQPAPTRQVMASQTSSATQIKTAVPPTSALQPTPTATPKPIIFDKEHYRDFAILRDRFPGFSTYTSDKSYTALATSMSLDGNKIAISACWGSISNNYACETRKSGFLVVIDTTSGEVLNDIPLESNWPGQSAFSPDGNQLLYSTDEQKIVLWDLQKNKAIKTFLLQDPKTNNKFPDVIISPDDQFFIGAVNDFLYVWDLDGKEVAKLPVYQGVISSGLTFNTDGSLLAIFTEGRDVIAVYNTSDWSLKEKLAVPAAWSISFSPDGRYISAVDVENNVIKVFQVTNGDLVTEIQPDLTDINIQFSPASDLLVVSGFSNLENKDDYSLIAKIYETQTWSLIDNLYSFADSGKIKFTQEGNKMASLGGYQTTIWALPDQKLLSGLEKVKQFQQALATGDYSLAASLFTIDENEKDYLIKLGVDVNDLPGSFARLCKAKTIFCYPVKELVVMGYDWEDLTYLVRLETPSGETFTSPKGAQIIYLYMRAGKDGQPSLISLPQEY